MTKLLNNFEGQADGVAITAGNSGGGSGDAFNTVSGPGVYDNGIVLEGSRSLLIVAGAAENQFLTWTTAWAGATEVWARLEGRLNTALPTSNMTIMNFLESGDVTVGCELQITPTGAIRFRAPFTQRYVTVTTLAVGVPFRLEAHVLSSATAGRFEGRLYTGANKDGTTPTESFGNWANNWDTGNGTVGGASFGVITAAGSAISLTVDAVGLSNEGWLGPSVVAPPASPTSYAGVLNALAPAPPPGDGLGLAALGTSPLGN